MGVLIYYTPPPFFKSMAHGCPTTCNSSSCNYTFYSLLMPDTLPPEKHVPISTTFDTIKAGKVFDSGRYSNPQSPSPESGALPNELPEQTTLKRLHSPQKRVQVVIQDYQKQTYSYRNVVTIFPGILSCVVLYE